MLLFEAKEQIDKRLSETLQDDYRKHIPEYFEALEIASKCIEAQMRLADIVNDWDVTFNENDSFSCGCVKDFLGEVWYEWEPNDDI